LSGVFSAELRPDVGGSCLWFSRDIAGPLVAGMRVKLALLATASLLAAAPAAAQVDQPQTLAPAPAPVPAQVEQPAPTLPTLPAVAATPPADAPPAAQAARPDDAEEDLVVTGRQGHPPGDPLEGINLQTYEVVEAVDKAVVGPAAEGYKKAIPDPIRAGVRNFFNNLTAPATFLNFVLQFKIGKAAETVARFGINSTVGVAGLVDVAKRKPFRLPLRRNGFANTFGFYGIKPGPFLFLPLVGPTTVRDLIGLSLDKALLPLAVGAPFGQPYYTLPSTAISSLDYRNQFDEQLRKLRESPDPYAASREFYLRNRQEEIDALRYPNRAAKPVAPIGPLADPVEPVDPEDEGALPSQERF
jgi:phospholipid-binding lipoprotein MlaA